MKFSSLSYAVTVLLFSLIFSHAHAAGIYKWVDAEGQVHYSEHPPAQGAKEIPIRSAGSTNDRTKSGSVNAPADIKAQRDKMIRALEEERLARQERKRRQQEEQKKRKMQCAQARDTLRRYKRASSLYKLDADGNRQALSDSARQRQTRRLQADINKWCK